MLPQQVSKVGSSFIQDSSKHLHRHEPEIVRDRGDICAGGTRIRALRLGHLCTRVLEGPQQGGERRGEQFFYRQIDVLGPNLIFVRGLVKFVPAVARLVCQDKLGSF